MNYQRSPRSNLSRSGGCGCGNKAGTRSPRSFYQANALYPNGAPNDNSNDNNNDLYNNDDDFNQGPPILPPYRPGWRRGNRFGQPVRVWNPYFYDQDGQILRPPRYYQNGNDQDGIGF